MRAIGPVKVVRDLEGAFAEAFEDIGWISGVRARMPFSNSPVFGVRVAERSPGVKQG